MAVEVNNYNMRHVSASKWREQELFSWWFVHGKYHYTGKLHCNEVNIILFTERNAVNLQLLVPYQECLALLDPWPCGFLGDIDSGNVYPCTTLIV